MPSEETRQVRGYCALCVARCGTVATVQNGRFVKLDPDPGHPTGAAICAKGRAAPDIVYSQARLKRPLRRTLPKGNPDPGWKEISWDEALDEIASALKRIAAEHGPQAVAFSQSSPSTTAISDSVPYVRRLMNAYGSPNLVASIELCGWGRALATRYVYGVGSVATGGVPGAMADIANAGCLILWGYSPSNSRITHATATAEALKRGMKLIVVDPRNTGFTHKADCWLRVRPGTDGVLALGIANILIQREWFDRDFIRDWTNGPLLLRSDTGRLLRASDIESGGDASDFVAWNASTDSPVVYAPRSGSYESGSDALAVVGEFLVPTKAGRVPCRPVFDHFSELCRKYSPERIEEICWIPCAELEEAARLIWEARPTAYYAWSGHEQHANVTETARAIAMLYALTGSFDAPGGNVILPTVPSNSVSGEDLPAARTLAPTIGLSERPLGPARGGSVTTGDFYRAVLEGIPYRVHGLIGFGANLLLAHADPLRGREALAKLDFYAHADLFMTPTAELADIVLPIASCFERETLRFGFEISSDAQSLVQLRPPVVPPVGESKSDTEYIFELAARLGLSDRFWNGDIDAAHRYQLAPSGLTLDALRAKPSGIRVPLIAQYRKYSTPDSNGTATGFPTPTRKVEFWSETFADHGYSAMPDFAELSGSPFAATELFDGFPLVLTCAKPNLFCQTQHRHLARLRQRARHPEVEIHPETATSRNIANGSWLLVETRTGGMRARARFNDKLDPRVVIGEHGWWQACDELGEAAYDPFSKHGANFNHTVDASILDPISGTPEHRTNACNIRPFEASGDPLAAG